MYAYVHMYTCECRCTKSPEDAVKYAGVELQAGVSQLKMILGTELGSSTRTVFVLNHWATPESLVFLEARNVANCPGP